MGTMRISQLAEHTGVPATTLRFYETAGLLPAERTTSGHRIYGKDAIERLSFISAAKRMGLPLEEIAELLGVWTSGSCSDVRAELRPRVAARLAEAEARLAGMASFTTTLARALAHLDALPDRHTRCDPECGFLTPASAGRPAPKLTSRSDVDDDRWRKTSVVCSLAGDDVAERIAQWHRLLDGAGRDEIADGIRLTLPTDRVAEIAALAAHEQQCCPFLDFRLILDGPTSHLEVSAPAEAAALLAELFNPGAWDHPKQPPCSW